MRTASGRNPVVVSLPIYGAGADIVDGAAIMPGTTAETDLGNFIVGASAIPDMVGTLRGLHDFSVVGDSLVAGTDWVLGDVELAGQYQPLWVEYDQSDTAAVASTSTTTVTITSLEDNIDTSWLYSTVSNDLYFIITSASGSCTTLTATGWTSSDTVIKILRLGHQLVKINTAADQIGTDAAVGSWTVFILENWFEAQGHNLQPLDPTKHSGLSLVNARFYAKLYARNTAGHTTE